MKDKILNKLSNFPDGQTGYLDKVQAELIGEDPSPERLKEFEDALTCLIEEGMIEVSGDWWKTRLKKIEKPAPPSRARFFYYAVVLALAILIGMVLAQSCQAQAVQTKGWQDAGGGRKTYIPQSEPQKLAVYDQRGELKGYIKENGAWVIIDTSGLITEIAKSLSLVDVRFEIAKRIYKDSLLIQLNRVQPIKSRK